MRVVHAIAGVGDPDSGVARNTVALDAALRSVGMDSRICTSVRELRTMVDAGTILHVHNSWTPLVMATAAVRRKTGCRLIVSPRGSMNAWALGKGKWKKRLAWLLGMRKVWLLADGFVATSEKERDEIAARQERLGIRRPIGVVRFGCELKPMGVRRNPSDRELHVLFLGRLEPVKGLDRLIGQLEGMPGIRMRIAGPDVNGYGKRLAAETSDRLEIEFIGEIHGERKDEAFAWADVLVLPSYTENFGSAIVEALSRGIPVIASRGTPWREVGVVGCGWWTDDFRTVVEQAKSADLVEMGRRGVEWMRASFTWKQCAETLKAFYLRGCHAWC